MAVARVGAVDECDNAALAPRLADYRHGADFSVADAGGAERVSHRLHLALAAADPL